MLRRSWQQAQGDFVQRRRCTHCHRPVPNMWEAASCCSSAAMRGGVQHGCVLHVLHSDACTLQHRTVQARELT